MMVLSSQINGGYHTNQAYLVGGAMTILKHMKVKGKDYPIYHGKNMFQTTNQIHFYKLWLLIGEPFNGDVDTFESGYQPIYRHPFWSKHAGFIRCLSDIEKQWKKNDKPLGGMEYSSFQPIHRSFIDCHMVTFSSDDDKIQTSTAS